MCQFENYLEQPFKNVFVRLTLLLFFIVCFSSIKAQDAAKAFNYIDSAEIQRRVAFQDSIFKGLIKPQPYHPSKAKKADVSTVTNLAADSITNRTDSQKVLHDFAATNKDSSFAIASGKDKFKKQKKIDTTHYSPKKAAIWGAAFPGLGQVYNKKYWKLPIVYGVIGTVVYFLAANAKKLRTFNGYIRNVYDSVPNPSPYDQLELDQIETYRNTYRKNVQLASFGTVIAWGLSIVDAVVDAHLHHFDISDKLSLRVKPELNYSNFTYYAGIGLNLRFK